MTFPLQQSLFLKTEIHQHEDLHFISSAAVRDLFSLNQTAMHQINSHTHTSHSYIINIDKHECIQHNPIMHTFHVS